MRLVSRLAFVAAAPLATVLLGAAPASADLYIPPPTGNDKPCVVVDGPSVQYNDGNPQIDDGDVTVNPLCVL